MGDEDGTFDDDVDDVDEEDDSDDVNDVETFPFFAEMDGGGITGATDAGDDAVTFDAVAFEKLSE